MKEISVKVGYSQNRNPFKAVEEVYKQIVQEKMSFVYFCLDKGYNQKEVNEAWRKKLANVPFIGIGQGGWVPMMGNLTGLITPQGIKDKGLVAISISSDKIQATVKPIHNLKENWKEKSEQALKEAARELNLDLTTVDPGKHFGLFFYNHFLGEVPAEELLDNYYNIVPSLVFVGGATIKFSFRKFGLIGGTVHTPHGCFEKYDAAIALIKSEIPFVIEMTSNYRPIEGKNFICGKVKDRVVGELNGRPAAEVYAEELGVPVKKLGTKMMPNLKLMTQNPFGAMIRDKAFTRVVLAPTKDKGLIFYQKMAAGQEIYLMEITDILEDTRKMLAGIKDKLGEISAIFYFPCILRLRILKVMKVSYSKMAEVLSVAPMIGIHMGGECYGGLISSITLTCLAFGKYE